MQLLFRRRQEALWASATASCGTRGPPAQCLQSSPPRARATGMRCMLPRCALQAPARFPRRPHNAPQLREAHQHQCSARDRGFRKGAAPLPSDVTHLFGIQMHREPMRLRHVVRPASCLLKRLSTQRVSALLACPREPKPQQGRVRAVGSSAVPGAAGCVSASAAARLNSAAAWTAASARSLAASSSRRGSNCCRIHSSSLCAAKYSRCCCCAKFRLYSAYLWGNMMSAAAPSASRNRARPHLASASASDRLAGSSLAANCLNDMSSPRLLPTGAWQERQQRRNQASPKLTLTVGARRRRADHARGRRKRLSSHATLR